MTSRHRAVLLTLGVAAGVGLLAHAGTQEAKMKSIELYSVAEGELVTTETVVKSEDEWQRELSDEQFEIARDHGTERAFTGPYWDADAEGVYRCVACGTDLFLSTTKFTSGTGWPSFYEPVHEANVGTSEDRTLWMKRTEVHCARCKAHLGHVFPDGPEPTGLRYCVNGTVLDFEPMDLDGDGTAG